MLNTIFSRKPQYASVRAATSDVECNALSQIAENFSSEDMKRWLRKGLKARDVNQKILPAIGQTKVSKAKAGKVAGYFNTLARAYYTLEIEQKSNSFRTEKGDIAMPDSTERTVIVQPPSPPPIKPDSGGAGNVFIWLLFAALVVGGICLIKHKTSSPRPPTTPHTPEPSNPEPPKPAPPKPPAPPENAFRIPTENERLIEFCKKTCPDRYKDGIFYFTESLIDKMDGECRWTKKIVAEIAEKSRGRIEMIWPEKGAKYSADEMDRDEPYTRPCQVVMTISPGMKIDGKIIRKAFVQVTTIRNDKR